MSNYQNKSTQNTGVPQGDLHTHQDTLQGSGSGVYRSSHTAGYPSGDPETKHTNKPMFDDNHTPVSESGDSQSHNLNRSDSDFGPVPLHEQGGRTAPSAGANISPGPYAVDQTKPFPETHATSKVTPSSTTAPEDTSSTADRHQSGSSIPGTFDSKGTDTDRQFEGTTRRTFGTGRDEYAPVSQKEDTKDSPADTRGSHIGTSVPGRPTAARGTKPQDAERFSTAQPRKDIYHSAGGAKDEGMGITEPLRAPGEHPGKPGVGDKIVGKTEKAMGKIVRDPTLQEKGEIRAEHGERVFTKN